MAKHMTTDYFYHPNGGQMMRTSPLDLSSHVNCG